MKMLYKEKLLDSSSVAALTLYDGILSDASVDAYDDTIDPFGIECPDFLIALLNHNKDWVIGRWHNPHVEKGAYRAKLELVPPGTSPHGDEARILLSHGFIRGVSIGFAPISSEPRPGSKKSGVHYSRVRLHEASLVSVPANSNAMMEMKSLGISDSTVKMLFRQNQNTERETLAAKIAKAKAVRKRAEAVLAKPKPGKPKLLTMSAELRHRQDVLARARKEVAKHKANKTQRPVDQPPPTMWRDQDVSLTWRGVRVPVPPKNRWGW